MSIWPLVLLPVLAAVGAIAAFASRDARGVALSLVFPLVAGGVLLLWADFRVRVGSPQLIGVDGLVLVVDGVLVWWILDDVRTGRARRLRAARTRFQFDQKLQREIGRLNAVVDARPADADPSSFEAWRASYSRTAELVVHRIAELRAPDADWSEVRDEYVALTQGWLAAATTQPAAGRLAELTKLNRYVSERVLTLRRAYQAEARPRDGRAG